MADADIANRLFSERKRLKLPQEEFARISGYSRATVAAYESGKTSPDLHYLAAIASLNVDINYVLTGQTMAEMAAHAIDWDVVSQLLRGIWIFAGSNGLSINTEHLVRILAVLYPAAIHRGRVDPVSLADVCRRVA